jgi:hypothetical protein
MVTATLHPAARRRLAERMPPVHDHDVVIRPLGGHGAGEAIVGATEQEFIDAVLADLEKTSWRQALATRRVLRRGSDNVLELTQPIHRRFYLVLYEAVCRRPGGPRVDPRRLDGMGLVLRLREDGNWSGWMNEGPAKKGWKPLLEDDADPDVTRRSHNRGGAAGHLDTLIAQRRGGAPLAEQVLPLFAAPVDLCTKIGRTVLYGLVPVASGERSEEAVKPRNYAGLPSTEKAEMVKHLSAFLKPRPRIDLPRKQQVLSPAWAPLQIPAGATGEDGQLGSFGTFLHQLMVELDAFGTGPAARELMRLLRTIVLPTAKNNYGQPTASVNAADFLAAAAPILVTGDTNPGGLKMPIEWPDIGNTLGNQLTAAALSCLSERYAAVVPQAPKFDGNSRQYAVRAFVRARAAEECPARIVWSDYSDKFRVLPWWDGDGPATKISLPSISDFKRMKPNVSFEVPPSLSNLLGGDMKKLKDGEDGGGPQLDIFWLCSFSLPIITLCAFIVLNIFLSLFNIIFFWMAFIKICIPIPRPK